MLPLTPTTDARDRILEAACEAIAQKSFNGCGLNEILAQAGVPKGSFYHYFRSKEDLGVAVVERARDGFVTQVRDILADRRVPALQRLRAMLDHLRAHCAASPAAMRGCLIAKLALEISELSEPVRAAVKCTYDQWGGLIAQIVREAQAAGDVAAHQDPERLANLIVNLWEGALIRMRIDRSQKPLDDVIAFLFEGEVLSR